MGAVPTYSWLPVLTGFLSSAIPTGRSIYSNMGIAKEMCLKIQQSKGGSDVDQPPFVSIYGTLVTLAKTSFVVMEAPRSERAAIIGKTVCPKG